MTVQEVYLQQKTFISPKYFTVKIPNQIRKILGKTEAETNMAEYVWYEIL